MNKLDYDLLPEFGARLRRLRENKGLSIAKLAVQAGLSKTTIHELEIGKRTKMLRAVQYYGELINGNSTGSRTTRPNQSDLRKEK